MLKPRLAILLLSLLSTLTTTAQTDGSPDSTFNGYGASVFPFYGGMGYSTEANGLVLLADGSIIYGGSSTINPTNGRANFPLSHFSATGVLDTFFGFVQNSLYGTKLMEPAGLQPDGNGVADLALLPNGKILVAGSVMDPSQRFAVFRIQHTPYPDWEFFPGWTNYKLDSTFGINGVSPANAVAPVATCLGMDVAPDGKILLTGFRQSVDHPGFNDIVVARYNADGSIDNSFGGAGMKVFYFGDYGMVRDVKAGADGSAYLVGSYAEDNTAVGIKGVIYKLRSDGTPDSTYGEYGRALTTDNCHGQALHVFPDGSAVAIASYMYYDFFLQKFTPAGLPDNAFGNASRANFPLPEGNKKFFGTCLTTQADGAIVVGGNTYSGDTSRLLVLRFSAAGALDPTFGTNGKTEPPAIPVEVTELDQIASFNTIMIQPDGKILAGGYRGFSPVLVRLNNDGAPAGISSLPAAATLATVYPQPVSGHTLGIRFSPAANDVLSTRLYDLSGRLYATLMQGEAVPAGLTSREYALPATLPNGTYLLRIDGRQTRVAAKVVVSR